MWIYDSTRECRSNKHITVAFPHLSQPLAGRFISQVNVTTYFHHIAHKHTGAPQSFISMLHTTRSHSPVRAPERERELPYSHSVLENPHPLQHQSAAAPGERDQHDRVLSEPSHENCVGHIHPQNPKKLYIAIKNHARLFRS